MKMKTVFFIISTLLLMGVSTLAAQNTPQTVIIRMWESVTMSQIITTKPDGKVDRTPLQKGGHYHKYYNEKSIENNSLLFQSEINKWKKEGFKIDGVTHSVYGDNFFTIIIMSKDEKE